MKTAVIEISAEGRQVSESIRKAGVTDVEIIERKQVGTSFHNYDAFIFIGALGICVRTIAPYVADKHTDPAVICIDSTGKNVISVLSGHVGGANELTRQIAAAIGAHAVITTQSDNTGLWPLDLLPEKYGWYGPKDMNNAIFTFVNREPTALLLDIRDEGTEQLERTLPPHVTLVNNIDEIRNGHYRLAIIISHYHYDNIGDTTMLHFIPRVLTLGIGLAHQTPHVSQIVDAIERKMKEHGLEPKAVRAYATIDMKADEPVVKYLQEQGDEVHFFTAKQLSDVKVPTPSQVVEQHVGTPSVSEAAAIQASDNGILLLEKQKDESKEYTFAVAIDRKYTRQGHIEIVGAGPGDPDLVSVRGRKMLERADLILYAGSLVPRELTTCAKAEAVVRSSAGMDLDEQCALMKDFYDRGKFIVRLHTGDPCIFGAIQEQMAFFDKHHMAYHITPGISSFLAAAAELRSQFTIPERVQTIILTRGEGRTPMPDKEKLHLLARSQSTMCIFLSAAIVDDVQHELLLEYPENTPVAACYHLTWPDQRIYRGKLKDLARIVHDNHLTLTTMLVVGDAIDNRENLSKLYDKHFTHLFREGK